MAKYNKIIFRNRVIFDISDTNANARDVKSGKKFYDSNVNAVNGIMTAPVRSGNLTVTENGLYNILDKENIIVNIEENQILTGNNEN